MNLICAIIVFLIIGNTLGKIILIQNIPRFKIAKKHSLTVIKLYYGFYIYLFFDKEKDWRFKVKYIFFKNKFIMFTYCFCHCLEEYIVAHPQKEAVCKKNIDYIRVSSMRTNIYRNTEKGLMCA